MIPRLISLLFVCVLLELPAQAAFEAMPECLDSNTRVFRVSLPRSRELIVKTSDEDVLSVVDIEHTHESLEGRHGAEYAIARTNVIFIHKGGHNQATATFENVRRFSPHALDEETDRYEKSFQFVRSGWCRGITELYVPTKNVSTVSNP